MTNAIRILGLDPGLRRTGWGVIAVDGARISRSIQITSGIGLIVTYVYGVYDGIRGYRRESRERALLPYASPVDAGGVVGVRMKC